MTKVKVGPKDELLLPKAVMDAHGFTDGAEVEVSGGANQIVLRLVKKSDTQEQERKLTVDEFLARRVPYDGPPVTDAMMHEAVNRAAMEDWARMERQWDGSKDD